MLLMTVFDLSCQTIRTVVLKANSNFHLIFKCFSVTHGNRVQVNWFTEIGKLTAPSFQDSPYLVIV